MNSEIYVETKEYNFNLAPRHSEYRKDSGFALFFSYDIKNESGDVKNSGYEKVPLSSKEFESFIKWLCKAETQEQQPAVFTNFTARVNTQKKQENVIFIDFDFKSDFFKELSEITKGSFSITVPFYEDDFNLYKWDLILTACEYVLSERQVDFSSYHRSGTECEDDFWEIECKQKASEKSALEYVYKVCLPHTGHYHRAENHSYEDNSFGYIIDLENQKNAIYFEAFVPGAINQNKKDDFNAFTQKWQKSDFSFNVETKLSPYKAAYIYKIQELPELSFDSIYQTFFESPLSEIKAFFADLELQNLYFSLKSLDKYDFMSALTKEIEPFKIDDKNPFYRVFLKVKNTDVSGVRLILLQFDSEKITLGNSLSLERSTYTKEFLQTPSAFVQIMDEIKKMGVEV